MALLQRSVLLAVVVSVGSLVIALPAAWLTTRSNLPFRRVWSVVLAIPLAVPSYITAMAMVAYLGPRGFLQGWLEPFGIDRMPEIYGFRGAAFTLTVASYPYLYLVLRVALQVADRGEEEASRSLGVRPFATFMRITMPALVPAIAAGLLLVVLYTLSDFGAVSLLRYSTFTRDIFIEYQSSFDRTGAAVLSSILAMLSMVVLALELLVRLRAGRGRARRRTVASPADLGRWAVPATVFLGSVAAVSLALPVGVLVYWLLNGISAGAEFPSIGEAARHSLTLAVAAGAVTVALALPVAVLAARYGGFGAKVVEQAAYLTHALPGLVVALALVFFGIRYATSLYQTTWMLLLAYVVLFLPNALSALRASLLRQPARLEEAAASLGRPPIWALATITLPLARPGMAAAFALVVLTVMKELPATLLLSPPGYESLPGLIWSRTNDAMYAGAALPALVLIALAAIPIALLTWRGELGALET